MARYDGGTQVESGYYWNPGRWAIEVVPPEGGRLPGPAATSYVKVPFAALFVIVPLLGAVFLMFLPLIGFALFGYAIVKRVTGGVRQGATELAATIQPGQFAAGEAYFAGKPGEPGKPDEEGGQGEPGPSPEIAKLEQEIAERKDRK